MTLRTLARQLEKMDDLHKHQLMTEARACQPLGIILCKLSIKNTIQDNTKEVFFYPPQLKEQMRQSTLNILNSPVLTGNPWKPLPPSHINNYLVLVLLSRFKFPIERCTDSFNAQILSSLHKINGQCFEFITMK